MAEHVYLRNLCANLRGSRGRVSDEPSRGCHGNLDFFFFFFCIFIYTVYIFRRGC